MPSRRRRTGLAVATMPPLPCRPAALAVPSWRVVRLVAVPSCPAPSLQARRDLAGHTMAAPGRCCNQPERREEREVEEMKGGRQR
ncbi:hypothetical protein U9M48_028448 [Paspalum notatum var. saurae]|uniref:Uncharacterized protein n=1 Tax=Paspalum notatum var. saurae TaxID=547442 RepID=A0AAQ3X101_PASNO